MSGSSGPNEAMVRAMPTPPYVTSRLKAPGMEGTSARMNEAIVRAVNVAVAREIDRAAPDADIILGFNRGVACAIASFVRGLGPDRDPLPIIAEISAMALASVVAIDTGTTQYTVRPEQPGRRR